MTNTPTTLTPAGERWVARTAKPLDVLAIVFLVNFVLLWAFPDAPPGVMSVFDAVSIIVWFGFALDYVMRMLLSRPRRGFILTHKLDLLMVLLPMLRLLRVFLLLRRSLAAISTEKIAGSIVSVVVAVVFLAAFFEWRVEYDAPGASITTFRDAIWWAVVTTTTVGYGDYSPVTPQGRIIAIILMIVGIGLIGTVSATVASYFIRRPASPDDSTAVSDAPANAPLGQAQVDELITRLDALAAQQAEIRALLEENAQTGNAHDDSK